MTFDFPILEYLPNKYEAGNTKHFSKDNILKRSDKYMYTNTNIVLVVRVT